MSQFLIACGGTGGHLSPGIAVAQCLLERGHGCKLLISRKDVDSKLVAAYPELEFERSPGTAFSWRPFAFLKFNWYQVQALRHALKLLTDYRPDAIIGFGGFLTVGAALAGFLRGVPIILHEANRRPGRAIRAISGLAKRIYLPRGVSLRRLPPAMTGHCGYPVRREIRPMPQDEARRRLGLEVHGRLLLVLGGSQGALSLNKWAREQFKQLAAEGINLLCITGLLKDTHRPLEAKSRDGQTLRGYFMPFTTKMSEVLSAADLVVSRGGAGSIAELIRCRLPGFIVPYPHATDDHQTANARFAEQQGGLIVLPQTNLEELLNEVVELAFNDFLLSEMRKNLERMDRDNSTETMVADIEVLLRQEEVLT